MQITVELGGIVVIIVFVVLLPFMWRYCMDEVEEVEGDDITTVP